MVAETADSVRDLGTYDYVIVGAGSAGCVLANRLSEDPANRVALLEAGGKDNYIWTKIPIGYLYCMGNPRTDWQFRTEPVAGLNGRDIGYPRGRILGGCSSINGMIYMRGQSRDYDHWRQLGNMGWGWEDILPYFKKSEDNVALPEGEHHGKGGEWRVEDQRLNWEILDAFRDAAIQAGLPYLDDFNSGDNHGVGYFHVNQKNGWRWNTVTGFLKPVRSRTNLDIQTHSQAAKVEFLDGRAASVKVKQNAGMARIHARCEIILAAGAIGSPQILQVSGVGPVQTLTAHGIDMQSDLPGVGQNLQDHLQIRCVFKVSNVKTLNRIAHNLVGRMGIGMDYALFRKGPMSMAPSQLGAFARTDETFESPNVEYHIQPLSLDAFGEPLHKFDAFTASVCNLRPESRGSVTVKSADPFRAPAIQPNYLAMQNDRKVAADSIRLTRKIVSQDALKRYQPTEYSPGIAITDDYGLAEAAGNISSSIFHPVGTCKMGDDPDAVVDARLRVRSVRGLRIVDASVMPTITSGNTNSPVIMIAEKAADMIIQDNKNA